MFTGLVQAIGTVTGLDSGRLGVQAERPLELAEGGSVAVNGVCLTAAVAGGDRFEADVVAETLDRSSLSALGAGDRVNLELALRAGDPLGGHMVQGHVDGVGTVEAVEEEPLGRRLRFAADADVLRYVVEKGSITVDGVSLTVASVADDAFSVALIPETLERTTLGLAQAGTRVNLEVDVLAKYVEKLTSRGPVVA